MLGEIEGSAAVNKRRKVLDLDINGYLDLRSEIISELAKLRAGEEVSSVTVDKLNTNFELSKRKTLLNVKMDAAKYNRVAKEYNEFDQKLNEELMRRIDEAVAESKDLRDQIARTEDLLDKRRQVASIVRKYTQASQSVSLTKAEVEELFGSDDKTDISVDEVLKDAQVTKSDRQDPSQSIYTFKTLSTSSSLGKSCQKLQEQIDRKIEKCKAMREQADAAETHWNKLAEKIVASIEALQAETKDLV